MKAFLPALGHLLRRPQTGALFAAFVIAAGQVTAGLTVSLGSASGDATESQRAFQFPAANGLLLVTYDMYNIPDSMLIYANGVVLTSTGGQVQGASTLRIPISGQTSASITVNPGSGLAGTAWTYSVSFTIGDDIPAISGYDGAIAGQTLDLGKDKNIWGDPVSVGTGAHVVDWPVIAVNGARELVLRAGYNSLYSSFGQIGRGWHHNFEARLSFPNGGGIYFHPHAAELHAFRQDSPGNYICSDLTARTSTIARAADGSYTLTESDQSKLVFDGTGVLQQQIDPHGRAVVITRTSGRITRITEPIAGVYLNFEYNPQGFLTRVTDNSGRGMRFGYDTGLEGKLVSLSLPYTGSPSASPAWQFTYNPQAQLERATDPDGRLSFINYYDDKGRIASQDDGLAGTETTKFIYDETSFPGRLTTTVVDRNLSTIRFTLDADYRLTSRMNQNGVQTNLTYDALSQELALTESPLSRIDRFVYDTRGNLTKLTTPDGSFTTYAYDTRNNLTSQTDATGKTSLFAWDTYNRPSQITLADGTKFNLLIGSGARIESITTPAGRRTNLSYSLGRISQATDPSGVTTRYAYDSIGRQTTTTNGLGNTLSFAYDTNDNIISVTSPLRRTGTMTYSGRRELLTATDPAGAIRRYAYDGNGNLVEQTDPLGAKTRFEYDPEDRLTAMIDATGGRLSRSLDRAGRINSVTDPLGNVIRYTRDILGNVTRITDALNQNVAQLTYDLRDRVVSEVDALGRSTGHTYDALGRHVRSTDPLGRSVQYTFDSRSRITAITNAAGETVRQLFDADNRVVAVQDARGYIVDYEFDAAGRPVAITTAEGKTSRMNYDGAGQLVSVNRPSGIVTTLTYDADGRISRITDPSGEFDIIYDAAGRITSFRNGTTTLLSHTFDAAGRRLTYRDGANALVSSLWDAAGRLTQLTYPSGRSVTYTYDLAGQLTTVTDWAGRVTRYTWDKNRRLTKIERANGTSQTKSYDAKGQLTQLRELGPGAAVIAEWTFTYDAAGQLIGEVMSPTAPAWQPTAARMYVDADNRITTFNGQTVQFDADGNLKRGPLADGSFADLAFNARSRLVSAGALTYAYDVFGQRSTLTNGAATTRFVHDPNAQLPRVLAAVTGTATTEFVYGLGLLAEETSGQVRYYHFDRRGSTVALSDATGIVQGRAYYGPWGENAGTSGQMEVRFRFHGELGVQTDPNGLLLMGARYYHPLLRRFISADPVQFRGGVNWYVFAANNPVSKIDPLGLWEGPGHTTLTNEAVSQVGGFSEADVRQILKGNLSVDRATNHIGAVPDAEHNMPGKEQIAREGIAWKIKRAVQLEMEGKHNDAMYILGSGLHSAQDINHAMSPDPSLWRHFWGTKLGWGYDPDNPAENTAAWGTAEGDSLDYLRIFQDRLAAARAGEPVRVGWKGVYK